MFTQPNSHSDVQHGRPLMQPSQDTYQPQGKGLKDTLHGVVYQLGLLLLIFKRAIDQELDFKQATEWEEKAGKFDDAVIIFRDPKETNCRTILHAFQAKHKQENNSKIRDKDLLNISDGDFSLLKYFKSFLKLKKEKKDDEDIGDLVIYTNAGININAQAKELDLVAVLKEAEKENKFIKVADPKNAKQYKFNLTNEDVLQPLYESLSKASQLSQLAKCLAEYIYHKKKFQLRDPILKKFHVSLGEHIFDIKKKLFKDDFIKGKTNNKTLTKLLENFKENLHMQFDKHRGKSSFKDYWDELPSRVLEFSDTFGKRNKEVANPSVITDDEISHYQINEFLENLIIAVNQPNESELFTLLGSEFGAVFNLIDSDFITNHFQCYMLDWLKQKEGTFITKADGKKFLRDAGEKISKLALIGLTKEYEFQVDQPNIAFKEEYPITDILSRENPTHIIVCQQSTYLMSLSLLKSIKSIEDFKSDDSVIFLKYENVIRLDSIVKQALPQNKLLVIEVEKALSDFYPLIEFIKNFTAEHPTKKMLILIREDAKTISTKLNNDCEIHDKNEVSFDSFTEECQKSLLTKKIKINHSEKTVAEWFDGKRQWIDSTVTEILVTLPYDKPIEISFPQVIPSLSISNYYIPRYLERRLAFKETLLSDCSDHILYITSPNDQTNISNFIYIEDFLKKYDAHSQQLKDTTDNDEEYIRNRQREIDEFIKSNHKLWSESFDKATHLKKIFMNLSDTNLHIVERDLQGTIIWKESHGRLDIIKKYIQENLVSDTQNESDFSDACESKIISAEPGMGKSTVVHHMLRQDENNPEHLALNIVLSQHKDAISQYNFSINKNVIDFMANIFNFELIAQHYLEHKLSERKVKIYLDGFDEVDSTQQEKICYFLTLLRKEFPRNRIIVTTRRHDTQELENTLSTIAYSLRQVQKDEQIDYLNKYWSDNKPNDDVGFNSDKIEKFSRFIVDKFSRDINDKENEFMGIPLQLYLIAEVMEEDCRKFYRSDKEEPESEIVYDKVEFYEKVILKKIRIYLYEKEYLANDFKFGLKSAIQQAIIEVHIVIAFQILFPDNELPKSIFSTQHFSASELNAIGLVENIGDEYRFVHLTYAEYLVAYKIKHLLATEEDIEKKTEIVKFILTQIFTNKGSEIIAKFLKAMLEKSSDNQLKKNETYINERLLSEANKSNTPRVSFSINYKKNNQKDEDVGNLHSDQNILDKNESFLTYIESAKQYSKGRQEWNNEFFCNVKKIVEHFFENHTSYSIKQMCEVLDQLYLIIENHKGCVKVKVFIFQRLPDFFYYYLQLGFFPKRNEHYQSEKISRFLDIVESQNAPSRVELERWENSLYHTSQRVKEEFVELEEIEHYLMEYRALISTSLNKLTISKVVSLWIVYQEKKGFLGKEQINDLHKHRNKYGNIFPFVQLFLNVASTDNELLNQFRFQFYRNGNMVLLEKITDKICHIPYKISDLDEGTLDDFLDKDLTEIRLFILVNSSDELNLNQLRKIKSLKDTFRCKYHKYKKEYLRLFGKLRRVNNMRELAFVQNFALEENLFFLFEVLNDKIRRLRLTPSDIDQLFKDKKLTWLERTGIAFLYKLKAVNYKVVYLLREGINESPIGLGYKIYTGKVLSNYLNKLLNTDTLESINFNVYAYLILIDVFLRHESSPAIIYTSDQMDVLFKFFSFAFAKQPIHKEVVNYLAFLLSNITTAGGLKIFQFNRSLLIVDPRSDYQFTLPLKYYDYFINDIRAVFEDKLTVSKDEYCQLTKTINDENEYQKSKDLLSLALDNSHKCEKERSLGQSVLRKISINHRCKLAQTRKSFLFSPTVVTEITSACDFAQTEEYLQALNTNRYHDAMQIYRKKPKRSFMWSSTKRKYMFDEEDGDQNNTQKRFKY